MSLKSFHIVFILVSIILTAGFAWWCFFTEGGASLSGGKAMGAISAITAVGLVIYLIKVPHRWRGNNE